MNALARLILIVALGQSATTKPTPWRTDEDGFCTEQVVRRSLRYTEPDVVVRINVALGTAVSVEFPPLVGLRADPPVGNSAILDYATEGGVESSAKPLHMTLWPKIPQGVGQISESAIIGSKSNMHIMLVGGITIILEVKIAESNHSVQRLVFDFPEREKETFYVQQKLAEERHKLAVEKAKEKVALDQNIVLQARSVMARAMLDQVHCENLRERSMQDLLVVRATRLCRIGNQIFVHFNIKNRARDLFSLGKVEIRRAIEGGNPVEAIFEYGAKGPVVLGFDGEVFGVAAFEIDTENAARVYSLSVTESIGKKRSVILRHVSF